MNGNPGAFPGSNGYGPPPSSTGYRNSAPPQTGYGGAPPPPTGAYGDPRSGAQFAAPPPSMSNPMGYGPPSSGSRQPGPPTGFGQSYGPPSAGPPGSAAYPASHHSSSQQPVSQAELLNRLMPTPPQAPSTAQNAPSYRAHPPPPIATAAGNPYGTAPDSTRSLASSKSSGSQGGPQQQYYTGAPNTANNRAFTPAGSGAGHAQQGGYPPAPVSPVGSSSRIDPSQMPRPDKPLMDVVFPTKSGSGRRNPPTCNSIYTALDTGNCTPRHIRATLVAPPTTKAILDKTGLPFALLATPFADAENGEKPVPEVDLGPVPPRCTRCRAYVNASVAWGENGNVWSCNLCSMVNDVPPWYYSSLDGAGLRMDRASHPELTLGSVDFLVNEDYCIRGIQEPIYVFALDISHKALANGLTMAGIRAIRAGLEQLRASEAHFKPAPPPTAQPAAAAPTGTGRATAAAKAPSNVARGPCKVRAAIVTFDREVQFYTVNMRSADPIKMYVCSPEDPLCPLPPDQWLLSVTADDSALDHLLQRIPELIAAMHGEGGGETIPETPQPGMSSYGSFSNALGVGGTPRGRPGATPRSRPVSGNYENAAAASAPSAPEVTPCCVAAAVKAIQEGLDKVGGRVLVMSASHATVGFGALSRGRERVNLYGTRDEINLYGYANTVINGLSVGVKESAASALSSAATALGATVGSAGSQHASKVAQQLQEQTEEMRKVCAVYRDLATACARSCVTVSVLACVGDDSHDGGPFFDTALLGEVVLATGGQFHLVTGALGLEDNALRLEQQLVGDLEDVRAAEAVAKLRTSVGLRVDKVLGPGVYNAVEGEAVLCGMDKHTSLMFSLCHDSALKDDERVHFQLAVLHTTPDRRRMIRVHNLSCIATPKPTVVFRNSDIETVLGCLAKDAVDRALTYPLSEDKNGARFLLDNTIANALHKYRIHCSPASPSGQLVLPDSMKIMPVFVLGMLKHPALMENRPALGTVSTAAAVCPTQSLLTNNTSSAGVGSSSSSNLSKLAFIPTYESALSRVAVRAHERAFELRRLLSAPLVEVVNSLYPRMYNFSSLLDDIDAICGDDFGFRSQSTDERPHGPEGGNLSNDSIDVSDEYLNNSTGSVSFNNLLGRHAVGLQLENPSSMLMSPGGGAGPVTTDSALLLQQTQQRQQLLAKSLCTVCPSAQVFEGDQIYLLDDRTSLYMYVGRNIPRQVIDDLMETTPGVGGLGKRESVSLRVDTSELARRMQAFINLLRSTNAHKQELRVVWAELSGNNPLIEKFSSRLIEDSYAGLMSYVDYLCNIHIKIQGKAK